MPRRIDPEQNPRPGLDAFVRRHGWLLVLLALDIITKVAAFGLLPHGERVSLMPGLQLYLAVNEWGVMGGVKGIGSVTANPAYTMLLAAGLLSFAVIVVRIGLSGMGFAARLGLGTFAFFAIATAAEVGARPLAGLAVPADLVVPSIRFAALAVAVALYSACRAPWPRAAFTLLAAGALANNASYVYPPFEVVDFVMVPVAPLLRLLGNAPDPGGGDMGVINLADMYVAIFPALLLLWPPAVVFGRLRGAFAPSRLAR
jgi:lipoprotein signal peptidase